MELFVEIDNGFSPLSFFVKSSILDVLLGSEYLSADSKAIINFLQKQTTDLFDN